MNNEYMQKAYEQAIIAKEENEVPIGAIIVKDNYIIAEAHNLKETKIEISAHAEILALNIAAQKLGSWKLNDCDMYVTLEPCMMCYSAIKESRINKVYYCATQQINKKKSYRFYVENDADFIEIEDYKKESETLLKDFFKKLRS